MLVIRACRQFAIAIGRLLVPSAYLTARSLVLGHKAADHVCELRKLTAVPEPVARLEDGGTGHDK